MNNCCSTDFYDECMQDDFPYRVIINPYIISVSDKFSCYPKYNINEEELDRFDILDIRPKKIESKGITIEQVKRKLEKIKEEVDSNSGWKYSNPNIERPFMSEENLINMIKQDFDDYIKENIRKFKEETDINDRWEIIDL